MDDLHIDGKIDNPASPDEASKTKKSVGILDFHSIYIQIYNQLESNE